MPIKMDLDSYLLVEDTPEYSKKLLTYLGLKGFNVDLAETCEDAIELLQEKNYKAMIVDQHFMGKGGMQGNEFVDTAIMDHAYQGRILMNTMALEEVSRVLNHSNVWFHPKNGPEYVRDFLREDLSDGKFLHSV